jgi:hypothetical protein
MSRFFVTARLRVAPEFAPSVWVATNTISAGADRRSYGMAQKAKLEEANKDAWSTTKVWPSASIGSSFEVANPPLTSKIIDVQDAERPTMVPSLALTERRIKGLTTYNPSSWSRELSRHNLTEKYPNLVKGITQGFNLGITSITKTYTPQNHISIDIHHDHYMENIDKEFRFGHYLGPYSRSEVEAVIGPFQSSPLSLVPKEGKPNKFQAVHDFSHPHNPAISAPSINSDINASNYPCTWGTFEMVCLVIARLPPGSRASV